ncbi:MAG TPA: 2'-deoxycytidine 5'-triphosphate deaminase [Steroidobacteraceae bacterium]|nr:2'-deoxycytidine 5'-triphosphate deaminase [Steroidobacteraceae bacterium]
MEVVSLLEGTARSPVYTGILPCQKIVEMVANGSIVSTGILSDICPDQIQPASIDLRLGDVAYPIDASFLPGKDTSVLHKMRELDSDFESFGMDLRKGAVLERGRLYVVPLQESVRLRSDVAAFANPKSSTGRLDILTRLIADQTTHFDQLEEGYAGQLYLEIAPRSFSVVVRAGTRLNQLRFQRTRGEEPRAITGSDWRQLLSERQITDRADASDKTGFLPFSIDLKGSGVEGALVGWRARKHTGRIDLDRRDYDPLDFWEPIRFHRSGSLILDPDEFYILMTKEAIAVPPDFAAEMLPYDTRAGEFRVHYAGFFDPGFGWDAASKTVGRTRGVLEVRSHEVPFVLEHGQRVGWLKYERMAERPQALYGREFASNYQGQELKLSKQFRTPAF